MYISLQSKEYIELIQKIIREIKINGEFFVSGEILTNLGSAHKLVDDLTVSLGFVVEGDFISRDWRDGYIVKKSNFKIPMFSEKNTTQNTNQVQKNKNFMKIIEPAMIGASLKK